MNISDYNSELLVELTPKEAFEAILHVRGWWTNDLEGSTQKLNDEFTVRFDDIHVSKQKLVEVIPGKKIVWLVTESRLNYFKNKSEWTGTKISFEISGRGKKTRIGFTHFGLVPGVECYNSCREGWDYYIKGSLFKLLTEGRGTPG